MVCVFTRQPAVKKTILHRNYRLSYKSLLELTDSSVSEKKKKVIWSKQTTIKDFTHTLHKPTFQNIDNKLWRYEVPVHLSFVNERVYFCCSLSLVRPVLRAALPRLRPPVVWKNGMPDPHGSAALPPLQRFLILRTRTHPPSPPPRPERPEHYPNPHHLCAPGLLSVFCNKDSVIKTISLTVWYLSSSKPVYRVNATWCSWIIKLIIRKPVKNIFTSKSLRN